MAATSRHNSKHFPATSKLPADVSLDVEVIQGGAVQVKATWPLATFMRRKIRMGRGSSCQLPLPFAPLAHDLVLFEVGRGKACVRLDQRLQGFVNDGHQFGDVKEYLAPRGSIAELATISDPLLVDLSMGARGLLRFADFDVAFRVARPVKKHALRPIAGAGVGFLARPHADIALENWAPSLGAVAAGLVALPLVLWLLKAPRESYSGLASMPADFALQVIHPQHFRYLPWAYREEFTEKEIIPLAVDWVKELGLRWMAEESGQLHTSNVSALGSFTRDKYPRDVVVGWKKALDEAYGALEAQRQAPTAERFYQFQKTYPRLLSEVSGGLQGSLDLRLQRTLGGFDRTQMAIESQIRTEHAFLKNYYEQQNGKVDGMFETPRIESVFAPPASPDFAAEKKRYLAAERFATAADSSQVRQRLEMAARQSEKRLVGNPFAAARGVHVLWLSKSSLLVPEVAKTLVSWPALGIENLVANAKYATNLLQLPPVPVAKPRIDMREVELVIASKQEEVKACYDAALRLKPRLQGRITWQWSINEKGQAQAVRTLEDTLRERSLADCIQARIRQWRFPRPVNGSVLYTYPFRFVVSPQGATGLGTSTR